MKLIETNTIRHQIFGEVDQWVVHHYHHHMNRKVGGEVQASVCLLGCVSDPGPLATTIIKALLPDLVAIDCFLVEHGPSSEGALPAKQIAAHLRQVVQSQTPLEKKSLMIMIGASEVPRFSVTFNETEHFQFDTGLKWMLEESLKTHAGHYGTSTIEGASNASIELLVPTSLQSAEDASIIMSLYIEFVSVIKGHFWAYRAT
ncbi:MAG TPA: hypothetical protein PLZ57_12275 [Pseudobdellovibrionaceae bacterium]|nr:hypothetical protein [Pseudobdellovibrionaceae bacterium]